MKRHGHLIKKLFSSFIYLGLLTGVFTLASKHTSAWFLNDIKTNEDVFGETKAAYFAYGNGTKDKPFGIKSPRHLYNLAWLQYLGYFNKDTNHEVYFELADNISMTGWTLPPIGTTKYPFIGHFSGKPVTNNTDGKTYTISNLTVANTKDVITESKIPYAVKNSSDYISKKELSNLDIVGLFGCVGDIKNYNGDTYYENTDTKTATIHNLNLSSINITSQTTNTVVGIVAGYLDAKVDNIKISLAPNCDSKLNITNASSGITLGTTTYSETSEYTSVGYCESNYETSIDEQTNEIYQPETTKSETFTSGGSDNNWGGSLDMEEFYTRITKLENSYANTNNSSYSLSRDIKLDSQGNLISSSYGSTLKESSLYHYFDGDSKVTYNPKIGSINIYKSGNFNYLNAGSVISSVTANGSSISYNGNYLSISNSTLINSKTANTYWIIPSTSGQIYANILNTNYYLYINNNGNLGLTTNSTLATYWTIKTSNSKKYIISGSYCLNFENDNWNLKEIQTDSQYFYLVNQDQYYLEVDTTSKSSSLYSKDVYYFKSNGTKNNQIKWYVDDKQSITNNNTTYDGYSIYCYIDGEKWYLECGGNLNSGNNTANKQFYLTQELDSTAIRNHFIFNSSGIAALIMNLNTYELKYLGYLSNSTWYWCYNDSSSTKIYLDDTTEKDYTYISSIYTDLQNNLENCTDFTFTTQTSNYKTGELCYDFDDVTYLPLNVDANTYEATDKNTGYLIGGSNGSDTNGNLRVSNYYYSSEYNISYYLGGNSTYSEGSYDNVVTKDNEPYTVVKSNNSFKVETLTKANYKKYETSKTSFIKLMENMKNNNGLYGFHYAGGSISKSALIKAKKAYILGKEYENYQMPANSVDFNLKSKGYINFFAGTYGSYTYTGFGDNCFFSVHEVIRDSNQKIKEIREIKKIYECNDRTKSNSYLYEYVNSDSSSSNSLYSAKFTYKSGERKYEIPGESKETRKTFKTDSDNETKYLDGYTEIFDTEQLGNRNSTLRSTINKYTQNIFYFEIPVNDGEYCLGSIDDGTGAYLMYLDIGTNASTISRTTILEKFVKTNISFTYPTGIVYYNDEKEYILCLNIPTNYSGTTTIQNKNDSLNINNTNTSIKPTLTYDSSLSLIDSNLTNITIDEGTKGTSTIIQRLTYIDYNTNDGTTTKIVATKKDDGTNEGKYYTLEDNSWVETTADKVTIYKVGEDNVGTVITITDIDVTYNSNTIIFTFRIDGKDIEITYDLSTTSVSSTDGTAIYYEDGSYTITFKVGDEEITITLTKGDDGSYTATIDKGTITKNADGTYSIKI